MFDRDQFETARGPLEIVPVHHASLVLQWNGETIYCDPVGGAARYDGLDRPSLIVLTHHHGDHFDLETIDALLGEHTVLVAPRVVYDQMPADIAARTRLFANGDEAQVNGIELQALPMYNTTPERAKFHEKGVGNGYVFDFSGTRLYLSADTEPIAEMDGIGPVDIAFFPMNLPYTMTPDQVATCVEKVRPRIAYPYHYAQMEGGEQQNLDALVALVGADSTTKLRIRDWYRER